MTYVFDIDGTICTNTNGDYEDAEPILSRVDIVNKLFDEGHIITLLTARGMGRHENDASKAWAEFYDLTTTQLKSWNVKYHNLFLGKPSGDFYIDDKGVKDEDFFNTRD
tara:strand:+ start:219 stop:545 length:327 start_codon:yes stop_codon:yes gene_type:complete